MPRAASAVATQQRPRPTTRQPKLVGVVVHCLRAFPLGCTSYLAEARCVKRSRPQPGAADAPCAEGSVASKANTEIPAPEHRTCNRKSGGGGVVAVVLVQSTESSWYMVLCGCIRSGCWEGGYSVACCHCDGKVLLFLLLSVSSWLYRQTSCDKKMRSVR